jgi:glycosyltransferase involved in cell wall biosynthesis
VLPNLVPERYLRVTKPVVGISGDVTVGWGGTVATHPGDLCVTGGRVARAVTETGARFRVIGDGVRVRRDLDLADEPDVAGWVPLDDWPAALATIDVGIVPLAPTPFNAAKSALKMLEFASVGVPVVSSPTPDNLRLAKLGIGLLAESPTEWEALTGALIRDPLATAASSRREAAKQTYEAHAGRWWDAWTQARSNADVRLREKAAA